MDSEWLQESPSAYVRQLGARSARCVPGFRCGVRVCPRCLEFKAYKGLGKRSSRLETGVGPKPRMISGTLTLPRYEDGLPVISDCYALRSQFVESIRDGICFGPLVLTIATHLIFHSPSQLNLHFQLVLAYSAPSAAPEIICALRQYWFEINGGPRHTWLSSVNYGDIQPIKYLTALQVARSRGAVSDGVEGFIRWLYRVRLIESYLIKKKPSRTPPAKRPSGIAANHVHDRDRLGDHEGYSPAACFLRNIGVATREDRHPNWLSEEVDELEEQGITSRVRGRGISFSGNVRRLSLSIDWSPIDARAP
jgi:hypothetical protein